ncbi:MAG TPA: carboxypeptidase [Clostridiaceae bacterium]|nr:carboxypeptidase [Clostridiaceae bacterium]
MEINIDNAFRLLGDFVNMDSGSHDKADVDRFVDRVEREFKLAGMYTKRIAMKNTGDCLQCTFGSGRRKILLLGHMDTVFKTGTAAVRPFIKKGDILCGPGVLDMKGGIVVLLYAVKNVMNMLPKDTEIAVFLNSDEEIGSNYSKGKIQSIAQNCVAGLSFESAKPGTLTTERKGIMSFVLDVRGLSAHSGVNYEKGKSAINELAHKICSLYSLYDKGKEITVNIGTITGGEGINIVAGHAQARGEIRYFDMEDEIPLKKAVQKITREPFVEGTTTVLSFLSDRPPLKQDIKSGELFNIAKYEALKLGRDLVGRKTGGGGDVSFAACKGIPVLDGLGLEGENSHTEEEYALADSFYFKIELASKIILDIANGGI